MIARDNEIGHTAIIRFVSWDVNVSKVGDWQKKLEAYFSYRGIVGGKFLPSVMQQEKDCGADFATKFHGHRVLTDSFLDFFAETLSSAVSLRYQKGWPEAASYYVPCLLAFLTQFRGMRAAEILSLNGYPFDGYALQRNLKDEAIAIGSVVNGISSFRALYGIKTLGEARPNITLEEISRQRRKEEIRIHEHMIGNHSGLNAGHISALGDWNRLFHLQVHGARLALTSEAMAWITEKKTFSVGPRADDQGGAMYMNRSNEVAWMMLRTLPFLQLEDAPFEGS